MVRVLQLQAAADETVFIHAWINQYSNAEDTVSTEVEVCTDWESARAQLRAAILQSDVPLSTSRLLQLGFERSRVQQALGTLVYPYAGALVTHIDWARESDTGLALVFPLSIDVSVSPFDGDSRKLRIAVTNLLCCDMASPAARLNVVLPTTGSPAEILAVHILDELYGQDTWPTADYATTYGRAYAV